MKKNYETKFVKGLIERMINRVVTFKVKRYMPDDVFEQDPVECRVHGTLMMYDREFGKPYAHNPQNQFLLYYDVELSEWRTVRCTNLIDPAKA